MGRRARFREKRETLGLQSKCLILLVIELIWSSLARLRSLDTTPNNSERVRQIILKTTQQPTRISLPRSYSDVDCLMGSPAFQG